MSFPLSLTEQIDGSRRTRILQEFVTNSAVYPLFDAIRSISDKGVVNYWLEIPHYFLILAAFIQAWYLGQQRSIPWYKRALGNLIAPALYTAVDIFLEGWPTIISQPYHWIYWFFSLLMAMLYAWEGLYPDWRLATAFFKNVGRVLLFPVLYAISELAGELANLSWVGFVHYWQSSNGHNFIFLASLLLGLLLELADAQTVQYLFLLRRIARRLQQFSEWSFSPDLLALSIEDGEALVQRRARRAVLFVDIRGFTAWSENKEPETVVGMLNGFYDAAEKIIVANDGVKPHFIGDEVMTWFDDPARAVAAAAILRDAVQGQLRPYGLDVGLGLHIGLVIEGLLGSSSTRNYDIVGDTVNTASRLMAAAGPGELLVSADLAQMAPEWFQTAPTRQITAKGKREKLIAYVV
ncbi:MAG: adenylate/guanylate cyclase domain-containing protein [Candidatus Promineifilaceae bacterium]